MCNNLRPGRPDSRPELYTDEEVECLEEHITRHFGDFTSVFHELLSPDIHVDIALIRPTPERNYLTLVTMGMGAHRMEVPEELEDYQLERAEMMICLPPDWEVQSAEERCYWPLRWLKVTARLPGEQGTWLGWGHTIPAGAPLADNVGFTGVMLITPFLYEEEADSCEMPDGSKVRFYQLLPLYEEEMAYKLENGAQELLARMDVEALGVLDPARENFCKDE